MDAKTTELERRLHAYLTKHMPGAQDMVIDRLQPILGGASRLTFFLGYHYRTDGEHSRRAILRMMPETGGFNGENIAKEARIFEALAGTKVPVPRAWFWSDDNHWLGSPFIIMEQVEGCESSLEGFLQEPYVSVRKKIGGNFWTMLGELAKLDPVALDLIDAGSVPAMEDVWRLEMAVIENHRRLGGCYSNPLLEMLIRWLKKNPPPPAPKLSIVHGDYRSGNFLYNAKGEIPLLMDWESWRLGDPICDLVYSIWPNFQDTAGNAGRLIPVADAIAAWEHTTGFKASEASMVWYDAANHALGMGMLYRMRNEYFQGQGRESLTYFYSLVSMPTMIPAIRRILNLPTPTLKPLPALGANNGEKVPEFLALAATRYSTEYQRTIADANTARTLAIDSMALRIAADRFENAANNYFEDNQAIEALLRAAATSSAAGDLLADMEAVLREKASSLRVSDLAQRNERLCEVLIALHAKVEKDATADGRRLEGDIRQLISNQSERCAFSYNPFLGL